MTVRCWHCHRFIKLGFWRWWTKTIRCVHCGRLNKVLKIWTLERVDS